MTAATVSASSTFELEAELALGYGFHMAADNRPSDQIIGQIPVDSIHSPVTRVNFEAVAQRVGERTDYEQLILDVWTDGRIEPEDALKAASAVLRSHLDVFVGCAGGEQDGVEFEDAGKADADEHEKLRKLLNMSVDEIELSVRAANCLHNANIA